ncbi:MAG: hypothetical protein ABGY72_07185 [bacterium]
MTSPLPGRDGLEVLAEFRRQQIGTPVVVLTFRIMLPTVSAFAGGTPAPH